MTPTIVKDTRNFFNINLSVFLPTMKVPSIVSIIVYQRINLPTECINQFSFVGVRLTEICLYNFLNNCLLVIKSHDFIEINTYIRIIV